MHCERKVLNERVHTQPVRPTMNTVAIRKMVNAFVPNAVPSDVVPTVVLSAIDRFKRKHGGLWVGGAVSVSETCVSFTPNGLNQALHEELQPINLPRRKISSVRHEFGWFTGIVVVEHVDGEFRFRCYGAKRLAARMCLVFNLRHG
jgi:hypothetical protein